MAEGCEGSSYTKRGAIINRPGVAGAVLQTRFTSPHLLGVLWNSFSLVRALDMHCQGGELATLTNFSNHKEKQKVYNALKSKVKGLLQGSTKEKNTKHLNTLVMQSEFLKFAQEEKQDPIWKSFILNLKFYQKF